MTDNSLSRFQSRKYARWQASSQTDERRFQLLTFLAGQNKTVLDLGCGTGQLGLRLAQQNNQVVGLDLSTEAVKKAKGQGLTAYACNLETQVWPVPANHFDVVVAGEVIEHILDTDRFLQQIHRVLKKKGQLILSTPNLASVGRRLMLLLGRNPYIEPSYHPERAGHVRYFVKDSLCNLLRQNKFSIELLTSEAVVLNQSQSLSSSRLAKLRPTLGKSLIVKAAKQ